MLSPEHTKACATKKGKMKRSSFFCSKIRTRKPHQEEKPEEAELNVFIDKDAQKQK
jgi:hypothetical protein